MIFLTLYYVLPAVITYHLYVHDLLIQRMLRRITCAYSQRKEMLTIYQTMAFTPFINIAMSIMGIYLVIITFKKFKTRIRTLNSIKRAKKLLIENNEYLVDCLDYKIHKITCEMYLEEYK